MNEYLSTLGLCLRAGKLTAGLDAVEDVIVTGEVRLVILSKDAGDSVSRRIHRAARQKNLPVIRIQADSSQIGAALGRMTCAVCSIQEIGFAAAIAQKAAQDDPSIQPIAQQLSEKNSRIASRRGKKKTRHTAEKSSRRANQINRKKRGGERA